MGQIVAPNGSYITSSSCVTIGGVEDPGYISLRLQSSGDQGVYSCAIPDENGVQQFLHVGIYYGAFNSK